jgi:hypothetical protein
MNFFKNKLKLSQIENAQHMAIISTRIYVVLLALSVGILTLFNSLNLTAISATVQSPSLGTYDTLHTQYTSTLSCSCKQISIPYGTFISMIVSYHQVRY